MNILILDLDGTLMPSQEVDNRCYWQAVEEVLGGEQAPVDLREFEHVTDEGILNQWCQTRLGRAPNADEITAVKLRFLELLQDAAYAEPEAFAPMRGLLRWLDAGHDNPAVRLGIATGGWGHSARFKLATAGLEHYRLPLVSSDEALRRTDIMALALNHALASASDADQTAIGADIEVTYFGDGVWDHEACQNLGWRFVGIADGNHADDLRKAGAACVVPDYTWLCGPTLRARPSSLPGHDGCSTPSTQAA